MALTLTKKLLKKYETEKIPDIIKTIECMNLGLTVLPPLPSKLKTLNCSGNKLEKLPALPSGLKMLFCNNNKLTELPTLPDTLEELHCVGNQITHLPTLPKNLKVIWCGDNEIRKLPIMFDKLECLSCHNNNISIIPILPDSLKMLNCSDNPIVCFPEKLPTSFQALQYHWPDKYTYLPGAWQDHFWYPEYEHHWRDYRPIMDSIKKMYRSNKRLKKIIFCSDLQIAIDELRYRPDGAGYKELTVANKGLFIDL